MWSFRFGITRKQHDRKARQVPGHEPKGQGVYQPNQRCSHLSRKKSNFLSYLSWMKFMISWSLRNMTRKMMPSSVLRRFTVPHAQRIWASSKAGLDSLDHGPFSLANSWTLKRQVVWDTWLMLTKCTTAEAQPTMTRVSNVLTKPSTKKCMKTTVQEKWTRQELQTSWAASDKKIANTQLALKMNILRMRETKKPQETSLE